nr:MAG TPA: hypothetical protein [Caudoviricetes sp.]
MISSAPQHLGCVMGVSSSTGSYISGNTDSMSLDFSHTIPVWIFRTRISIPPIQVYVETHMPLINSRPQCRIMIRRRTDRSCNVHLIRPVNQHSTNELFLHNRHQPVEHFLILSINIHIKRMLIHILSVPCHRQIRVQVAVNFRPTVVHNIQRLLRITSKRIKDLNIPDAPQ